MADCGNCDGRYCDAETDGCCYRLRTNIGTSRRSAATMAVGAALGAALIGTAQAAEDNSPVRVITRTMETLMRGGVIYDYAIHAHRDNVEVLVKKTADVEFVYLPLLRI